MPEAKAGSDMSVLFASEKNAVSFAATVEKRASERRDEVIVGISIRQPFWTDT